MSTIDRDQQQSRQNKDFEIRGESDGKKSRFYKIQVIGGADQVVISPRYENPMPYRIRRSFTAYTISERSFGTYAIAVKQENRLLGMLFGPAAGIRSAGLAGITPIINYQCMQNGFSKKLEASREKRLRAALTKNDYKPQLYGLVKMCTDMLALSRPERMNRDDWEGLLNRLTELKLGLKAYVFGEEERATLSIRR